MLLKSVEQHLRADVPIGSFLSGGYDSSALVYYMTRGYKPETFSIGFKNLDDSEHNYAKIVADKFNVNLNLELADDNNFDLLDEMHQVYDEPLGDISIIPTYMVSKLAHKKVKSVFSGEGADEIFGGYNWQKDFKKRHTNLSTKEKIVNWLKPPHKVDFLCRFYGYGKIRKN